MNTFCLIRDGKAHELIEAEVWPFHEDLAHVDVTGLDVCVGDEWDGTQFIQTTAPPVQTSSPKTGSAISIYRLTPTHPLAAHSHDRSHLLVVAVGRVRIRVGNQSWEAEAPSVHDLPAEIEHEVHAVEGVATVLSIFERDL